MTFIVILNFRKVAIVRTHSNLVVHVASHRILTNFSISLHFTKISIKPYNQKFKNSDRRADLNQGVEERNGKE